MGDKFGHLPICTRGQPEKDTASAWPGPTQNDPRAPETDLCRNKNETIVPHFGTRIPAVPDLDSGS